ncbi:hypothetical protein PUN4_1150010 [Paraburkholderia unamae]|nr:hypothetical protein PUN4_1150010 [Paraburkholderia unamae]
MRAARAAHRRALPERLPGRWARAARLSQKRPETCENAPLAGAFFLPFKSIAATTVRAIAAVAGHRVVMLHCNIRAAPV